MPVGRYALFAFFTAAAGAAAAAMHSAAVASRPQLNAEQIVRAFQRVGTPAMSSGSSPEALAEFRRKLSVGLSQRNALALELSTRFPTHPKAPTMMWTRWSNRIHFSHEAEAVVRETEKLLAGAPTESMRDTALAARAMAGLEIAAIEPAKRTAWVLEAADAKKTAVEVAPELLEWLAMRFDFEPAAQRRLLEKGASLAKGRFPGASWLALNKRIGNPLAGPDATAGLDAIPGAADALAKSKGKPVLLHLANVTRDEERADITAIAEMRKSAAAKGGEVTVITLESYCDPNRADAARAHAKSLGIDWPFVVDPGTFEETFAWKQGIRCTPVFLLLDGDARLATISTRLAGILASDPK